MPLIHPSAYVPRGAYRNAHAASVLPTLLRRVPEPPGRRERIEARQQRLQQQQHAAQQVLVVGLDQPVFQVLDVRLLDDCANPQGLLHRRAAPLHQVVIEGLKVVPLCRADDECHDFDPFSSFARAASAVASRVMPPVTIIGILAT